MKVSLIRTEQTERTNNKTRTRRLRGYAPWFARCVSLIDWFQEVTKHSAIKKRKSDKQTKTEQNNKKQRNELKGEMKRNKETNKHLEDHRTKKRTPKSTTNRTITWANGKLTHRETDEPTARPPDRLTKRQTESATDRPTDLPSNRLTDRPTEQTNNRGNCVLKEQTNKIPTDRTKKRDKKRVTDPMHGQKDTEKNEQMNESEQNK